MSGLRLRTLLGFVCAAAGAGCLLYAALVGVRGLAWQESRSGLYTGAPAPSSAPRRGEAVARLRVERAGIDVIVAEGTDGRTLTLGPGHMEGTARPGEPDNCVIAGHRDGPFGRLRSVMEGDVVEIADASGWSRYRVTSTGVVDRRDASPLAPADEPLLTLVTCYPFNHVGPAPQRFIVRGELIGP